MAAGSIAAVVAVGGSAPNRPRLLRAPNAAVAHSTRTYPDCPARTGAGAYDTTLNSSSGQPRSTVTVSGPLPVVAENGVDVGQTSNEVDVYWNLNFEKWWSALGPSPLASIAGSAVRFLGKQDVAKLCTYRVQVDIPSVAPGTYPIEVLYHGPDRGGGSGDRASPAIFLGEKTAPSR